MSRETRNEWYEIGALDATFTIDDSTIVYAASSAGGSAVVGRAVQMSANAGVVALAASGAAVVGRLRLVESDGKCAVQVRGFMQLPAGNTGGATVTLGTKVVGAQSNGARGYIRTAGTGNTGNGQIIDPATVTAVWVLL